MTKNQRSAQFLKQLKQRLFLRAVFAAYRKTPETEEILKHLEKSDEKTDFQKIRCPLCAWRPSSASRWTCWDCDAPEYFYNGCGTEWNTFETRGLCPSCRHRWRWTSCLRCGGWSRHEDWYEKT